MAGVIKKTTGLVGLAVSQRPHEHLRILYSRILTSLQKLPQDAAYRKYTEQLITERLHHVKTETDVHKLEKKINCGEIEEAIAQGGGRAVPIQEDVEVETMGTAGGRSPC